MHGELGSLDPDTRVLRFCRVYPHPIDRVWRAVTEPERLAAWFPQAIVGDLLHPGAPLRFEPRRQGAGAFDGKVLRAEPPRLLEFEWGTDVIRLELETDQAGCRLTLTDTLDVLGKAARDGAGWHTCLDLLEAAVSGTAPSIDASVRWGEVHPAYVTAFGPDASSIGPPPSHAGVTRPD